MPTPLWRMMSDNRGCPNRVRHVQVLQMARALGLSVVDRVGACALDESVTKVTPHLSAEFRTLTDGDLGVLDAEITYGFDMQPQLGRVFRFDPSCTEQLV